VSLWSIEGDVAPLQNANSNPLICRDMIIDAGHPINQQDPMCLQLALRLRLVLSHDDAFNGQGEDPGGLVYDPPSPTSADKAPDLYVQHYRRFTDAIVDGPASAWGFLVLVSGKG
jgi:hypothetical protein